MNQVCRLHANGYFGVELGFVAALDAVDKVLEVGVLVAGGFFVHDLLGGIAFVNLEAAVVEGHPTFAAIEEIADDVAARAVGRDAAFVAGLDAADFKHDFAVAVIECGDLGIGRLLIVIVDVLAAGGDDGHGQAGTAEAPARDIHLVDALVADVAVAGVPEPVPVVAETQLVEGAHGRGPQELIPIETGRRGAVGFVADTLAALEAESLGEIDLADDALVEQRDGLLLVGLAAALRTDLDDAVILARGVDHALAFEDVVAGGLFHVDVLAVLTGADGGER